MKKIQKTLLGTALAGALVVGAGFGTFSYFSSTATVTGEITNGTLAISVNDAESHELDFGSDYLVPGGTLSSDSVTLKNYGTESAKLNGKVELEAFDSDGNTLPNLDLSKYIVTVKNGAGNTIISGPASSPITVYADYVVDNTFEQEVQIEVALNSSADNAYQGVTLRGNVVITADQVENPNPSRP